MMVYVVRPESTEREEFRSNTLDIAVWTAQHRVANDFPCTVIRVWECTDDLTDCHVVHRGAAGRGWHHIDPPWQAAA